MKHLLLTLIVLPGLAAATAAQTAPSAFSMLDAGRTFLATLDSAQKSKTVYPFNSEERFRWFYTPVSRKGIPLKELNATQQKAALELLHDEHHEGPFCLCFHEACRSGREGFWVHTGKPR